MATSTLDEQDQIEQCSAERWHVVAHQPGSQSGGEPRRCHSGAIFYLSTTGRIDADRDRHGVFVGIRFTDGITLRNRSRRIETEVALLASTPGAATGFSFLTSVQ
jgi:hypothetical protein